MSFFLDALFNIGFEASSPLAVMWFMFLKVGWLVLLIAAIKFGLDAWLDWRQDIFTKNLKWVTLAVDVPRETEQSPKAVEQIFSQLWGSLSEPTFIEKWWKGKYQTSFTLEIVSIGGYVQYIVGAPEMFRDLIEAAIYAQYPEAQITAIEDYTKDFTPENFKQKGYELWGAQFHLAEEDAYPIRTYPLFEHAAAKIIVDPLAALIEIFGRFNKGEQGWLQIIIKPIRDDWKDKSKKVVAKLLGQEVEVEKTKIDKMLDVSSKAATQLGDILIGPVGSVQEEKEENMFRMMNLTPQERETIELIQRKASKTGFRTKLRYIYLAKENIFSKPKGVSGVLGALKQFSLLNSNTFKACFATKVEYYRVEKRLTKKQKKILKHYKSRRQDAGFKKDGFIFNIEELASIYHFPYKETAAPSTRKAESRRGEAPLALPVEEEIEVIAEPEVTLSEENSQKSKAKQTLDNKSVDNSGKEKKVAPPEDLPV